MVVKCPKLGRLHTALFAYTNVILSYSMASDPAFHINLGAKRKVMNVWGTMFEGLWGAAQQSTADD